MLDAGNLKEFDEPYRLLRCKGTILYSLVHQTGHDEAQRLFEMSIKAHCARHTKEAATGSIGDCQGGCGCKGGVCPPNPIASPLPVIKVENEIDTQHLQNMDDDVMMTSQQNDVGNDDYDDNDVSPVDTATLLPTTEL